MHAVSQGALGIQSRRDDKLVIDMLNHLNHEETLLRCIAERTFLARLEGGCSAPVGVTSRVTSNSIMLEGIVLDLDGTRRIKDKFEIQFNSYDTNCPILSLMNERFRLSGPNKTEEYIPKKRKIGKRSLSYDSNLESVKKEKNIGTQTDLAVTKFEDKKHFCYLIDMNIDENKLMKSELCGLHLAEKLKEQGADVLISEVKAQVLNS